MFNKIIQKTVINPEKLQEVKEEKATTYSISNYQIQSTGTYCTGLTTDWADELKYLIITGPGLTAEAVENNYINLQRLAEWKKKKGIPTKIANVTEINNEIFNCEGEDIQEKIRNFIKDAYDLWGIEYVLLGGRGTTDGLREVPTRTGYGAVSGTTSNIVTDLYYSDLDDASNWSSDGDETWGETTDTVDLIPDVFVGRMLSTSDIGFTRSQRFVDNTLFYQKNPPSDYLTSTLFLSERADSDNDGAMVTNYTNLTFIPWDWNVTMLYESEGPESKANLNESTATAEINYGYHFINHVGHGSEDNLQMGAGNEKIIASDFATFTNGKNYSILYTVGCASLNFINGNIGNDFTTASQGGGVAWIGSTDLGWYLNDPDTGPYPGCPDGACFYSGEFSHQFFNYTFNDANHSLGAINTLSKNYFVPQASSDGPYRWLIYSIHTIGDPEMPVWTDQPENFTVQYLVNGQNVSGMQFNQTANFTVKVTNQTGGNVISGARVCLWQDNNIYNYTTTDSNGEVTFELTPNTTGDVNVTITKHNFFPLEANTSVADEDLTAPTTSMSAPVDFYNSSDGEINFTFTSYDNANLSNVSLWHNFTSWAINESNLTITNASEQTWSMNFSEGQYVWGILACDNSTNCGWSSNWTFTIDQTEPLISFGFPANNSVNSTTQDNVIDFVFNVSDMLHVVNCSLMINDQSNQTITAVSKETYLNVSVFLNVGTYNWSMNCSDQLNNHNGSMVYNLSIIDLVKPEVVLEIPSNDSSTSSSTVGFNFSVTETYLDTCELWGNWTSGWHLNQSYDGFTNGVSQNFSNLSLSEGCYYWNVWCNDTMNNANFSVQNYTFKVDNTGPGLSLGNPFNNENWTTGSVTFTYQVSDFSNISQCMLYINASLNSTDSTITKDTNQTFSGITLYNGAYEWTVNCTDAAGNSNGSETRYLTQNCSENWTCTDWSICANSQQTRTCTDSNSCPNETGKPSESQSCGGSSPPGGGGGGGGSSSSSSSSTDSETVSLVSGGDAGDTSTLEFSEDVGVTALDVTFSNDVSSLSVTVKKLTTKPSDISLPSGKVHSYLQIDKDISDEDVKSAKIRFRVEKSWLLTKGVLEDEIILKRYNSGWQDLETKKKSSDAVYVHYESDSPGFSYFAISTKKKQAIPKPQETEPETNQTQEDQNQTARQTIPEPKPSSKFVKIILISSSLIIIVAAALIIRKKQHK